MKNLDSYNVEELSTDEMMLIEGEGIIYEVFFYIGAVARTVYNAATDPNYTQSPGSKLMHTALH